MFMIVRNAENGVLIRAAELLLHSLVRSYGTECHGSKYKTNSLPSVNLSIYSAISVF